MPRRREVAKREVLPDPKYNDKVVAKFISCIMRSGKKNTAAGILYSSLDIIQEKIKDDPIKVFKKALDNVKPMLEVKSRRVGGATYQVPVEVMSGRRVSLGMRWLVDYAKKRGEKTMTEKLAGGSLYSFYKKKDAAGEEEGE